jgi:hypothetical protein
MLSQACHQCREGFPIAGEHSHIEECAACRAWAEKVADLSRCRLDLPLSEGLRNRLLSAAVNLASSAAVIDPLPQLPVPGLLRKRLLAIPDQQAMTPSSWFLKVRYGVAASLLFTFVSVSALGSTINRGHQSALTWSQRIDWSLQTAKIKGQESLTGIGETAAQLYGKTRAMVMTAPDQISAGLTGLSTQVIELVRDLGNDSIQQKEMSNGDNPNDSNRTE